MFKFPIIELVDRYCIARVKYAKLGTNAAELEFYQEQINLLDTTAIAQELELLTAFHSDIWDIENEFKNMTVDGKYTLEEIGRRAIYVRDRGVERARLKNLMAELLEDPVREHKRYGS